MVMNVVIEGEVITDGGKRTGQEACELLNSSLEKIRISLELLVHQGGDEEKLGMMKAAALKGEELNVILDAMRLFHQCSQHYVEAAANLAEMEKLAREIKTADPDGPVMN